MKKISSSVAIALYIALIASLICGAYITQILNDSVTWNDGWLVERSFFMDEISKTTDPVELQELIELCDSLCDEGYTQEATLSQKFGFYDAKVDLLLLELVVVLLIVVIPTLIVKQNQNYRVLLVLILVEFILVYLNFNASSRSWYTNLRDMDGLFVFAFYLIFVPIIIISVALGMALYVYKQRKRSQSISIASPNE